jgi:hypothetical protein
MSWTTTIFAAAFAFCTPLAALAESKRDPAVELDLRAVELHCPEDDEDEVKELSVYLVNRYLDEVMYYVWFRDGVVVEAGRRLKKKHEDRPKWLYLAKRSTLEGLFDFGETDRVFIAGLLKDAEPHVQAGCRVSKAERMSYAEKLKINLAITEGEAIPDPERE